MKNILKDILLGFLIAILFVLSIPAALLVLGLVVIFTPPVLLYLVTMEIKDF